VISQDDILYSRFSYDKSCGRIISLRNIQEITMPLLASPGSKYSLKITQKYLTWIKSDLIVEFIDCCESGDDDDADNGEVDTTLGADDGALQWKTH